MSQIGKKPISIPEGVSINILDGNIKITGKLGELNLDFSPELSVVDSEGQIIVTRPTDEKKHRELHGLTRALIANIISGVTDGFQKELQLVGVGFTADASKGNFLILNLGFSHQIYFEKPEGVTFETPNATTVIIKGTDKQLVGQVAAKIRELKKPEPFKGKGIRYSDEYVRRKAGKTIGIID